MVLLLSEQMVCMPSYRILCNQSGHKVLLIFQHITWLIFPPTSMKMLTAIKMIANSVTHSSCNNFNGVHIYAGAYLQCVL